LQGSWVLVRTRGFGSSSKTSWLLIKHRDQYASDVDVAEEMPRSAKSNRLLVDIAREGGGDVEKAATGDPKVKAERKTQPKTRAAAAAKPVSKTKSSAATAKKSPRGTSRKRA
jgi:bifunctional non-homologous end joining protein LigD